MKTSNDSVSSASRVSLRRPFLNLSAVFGLAALVVATSGTLSAQAPGGDQRQRGGDRTGDRGGDRGNMNPQEMQARMLNALRERLEVTDDEEWKVISDRVLKVSELRRASMGGGFGMAGRGAPPPGGGDRGGPRPGGSSNPELAALSSAVRDKLTDAEIKSRLDRVREVRKENEVKMAKAQEELKAVLTVRQEAIAVVFGLLP
jgi:hypothetical protein